MSWLWCGRSDGGQRAGSSSIEIQIVPAAETWCEIDWKNNLVVVEEIIAREGVAKL